MLSRESLEWNLSATINNSWISFSYTIVINLYFSDSLRLI